MRRVGSDYRGPCPLHHGVGANFVVSSSKQVFHCVTCDAKGDAFTFVQQWRGMTFGMARQYLAVRVGLGALADDVGSHSARAPKPFRLSPLEERRAQWTTASHELRAQGCMPAAPSTIHEAVLASLTLERMGAEYLTRRALDPKCAEEDGFRSIPSRSAWAALNVELRASFTECELGLAGLHSFPWLGKMPALVIPYAEGRSVVGLRFRTLAPTAGKGDRYRSLLGTQPTTFFNADALAPDASPLFLVEGELNAYTLVRYGLRAIGLPGAGAWRDEWAGRLARAVGEGGRLVAWFDDDRAGEKARARLAARLQAMLGRTWLERHCQTATLHGGDANDLHQRGTLSSQLERAGFR
jgi:DNA primase